MRTLMMLTVAGGLSCVPLLGASAAPLTVPQAPQAEPMMQQADWYCGPECQRHRYWEHRRAERHQEWRESHQYTYHYNNPYYRDYRGY